MSTVKFELDNLSPEGFRHEHASSSDFTLTCLTELSGDSSQWELQHSNSVPVVNSSPHPGITPQSPNSSSQPLCLPGDRILVQEPHPVKHNACICCFKDPLEKEMATHSSILAWRISRTEEPGGLQSMGSRRVRHN
ncbi:unnamed protein product [Rangifer tarandus platyrhynchus]|uniref:Uncharacterized protein n=1 Tax=Rangifer tarandus platyrhynchus TaxID=3082113 RepID=A0ABN8XVH7_RANTA|nr:unnamed protein product [Rangifer tarandus platyrhynchus]